MAGLMTYTSPVAAGLGAAAEMVRDIWGARRQQREDLKAEELRKLQLEQMGLQQALTKAQLDDLPAQRSLRDQQQAMQQWQAMQQALGDDVFNSPEAIGLGEKAGMRFTREFDPAKVEQPGRPLELGPGITPGGTTPDTRGTNALVQQLPPKQTVNPRTGIATPGHVLARQAKDARADYASRLQIDEAERAIRQRQARQDFLQGQTGPLSAAGAREFAALGGSASDYWGMRDPSAHARELAQINLDNQKALYDHQRDNPPKGTPAQLGEYYRDLMRQRDNEVVRIDAQIRDTRAKLNQIAVGRALPKNVDFSLPEDRQTAVESLKQTITALETAKQTAIKSRSEANAYAARAMGVEPLESTTGGLTPEQLEAIRNLFPAR